MGHYATHTQQLHILTLVVNAPSTPFTNICAQAFAHTICIIVSLRSFCRTPTTCNIHSEARIVISMSEFIVCALYSLSTHTHTTYIYSHEICRVTLKSLASWTKVNVEAVCVSVCVYYSGLLQINGTTLWVMHI